MLWIKVSFFLSNHLYYYYFTFISSQPRLTTSIYPRSSLDYITLWKMHSLMHFLTTSPCAVKSNTKSHILLFMFHSLRAFFFSWMKKKEEKKKNFQGSKQNNYINGFWKSNVSSTRKYFVRDSFTLTAISFTILFFFFVVKKNLSSKLLIDYVHIFSILQDNADYPVDVLTKICHSICICIPYIWFILFVFCIYLDII